MTATTRRYAGVSGIAFALLFGIGSAIWGLDMPSRGAAAAEIVEWYRETADRIVIGGSMSLVAIAVFLVFAAALRQLLLEAGGDPVLATASFAGAVLGMAAGLGAESINLMAALRAQDGELTPELAHSLFQVSQILGSAAAAVGGALFAAALGVAALRAGALPRWTSIALVGFGIVLITPIAHVAELPGAGLVALTAVVGGVLLRRSAA